MVYVWIAAVWVWWAWTMRREWARLCWRLCPRLFCRDCWRFVHYLDGVTFHATGRFVCTSCHIDHVWANPAEAKMRKAAWEDYLEDEVTTSEAKAIDRWHAVEKVEKVLKEV